MRLKNLDLVAAIFIAALNIGWVQIPNRPVPISIILALPFVLFFPGYTLTQMLFRKKPAIGEPGQTRKGTSAQKPGAANNPRSRHPVGRADQLILGLGLSMAIDILAGFALNILPIGLQPVSWTFSLGLLTVLFAGGAMFIRRRNVSTTEPALRTHITLLDLLFLIIALFITANAIWLAAIRPLAPQPGFTNLWILPANQASRTCAVSIGIQNFEASAVEYTLTMTVNNQQIAGDWSTITLEPQQKWTRLVPVTPEAQNDLRIEAQLSKADQPGAVYRDVYLTFHVSAGLQNGQIQQLCSSGA